MHASGTNDSYISSLGHLNSLWDEKEHKLIKDLRNKRKREMELVQDDYERKYNHALATVRELHPFFGNTEEYEELLPPECSEPFIVIEDSGVIDLHEEELKLSGHDQGCSGEKEDSKFMMDMRCCVCMDAQRDAFLATCQHICMCMTCAQKSKKHKTIVSRTHKESRKELQFCCPVCNKFSKTAKHVYFS